jgi:hypothetical protein
MFKKQLLTLGVAMFLMVPTGVASATGVTGVSGITTKTKVIDSDPGGQVSKRINEIEQMIEDGTQVVIRGNCWSACTLYLKLVETGQLCVYPSASFHFHAPYYIDEDTGERVLANDTYQLWFLMQYPNHVHEAIASLGGLTTEWMHVFGSDLPYLAAMCNDDNKDKKD